VVTETVAGISSRAAARCCSISLSSSRRRPSGEYGRVITPGMPQTSGGGGTTPAIVSFAWLVTAMPIAQSRAAQAPSEPSKATSTRWIRRSPSRVGWAI
jgi:hypothetical protein